MKAAFVSIIGRPSSGKSTLINTLCGHKVSIISPIPQTTRNKVRGILTEKEGQLVFIDTPGYHSSSRKFNSCLTDLVKSSLDEVDIALYVIDSSRPPGEEENDLIDTLTKFKGSLVIALNKKDIVKTDNKELLDLLKQKLDPLAICKISALKKEGIQELLKILFSLSPENEQMYPGDYYTDQNPEFRTSEIIREKALIHARQELPHAIYVEISDMEHNDEKKKLWIRAFLVTERESQKGILVGKGGAVIRQIRIEAQKELNEIFDAYRVFLDLRVKVNKKWKKKDLLLKRMIY